MKKCLKYSLLACFLPALAVSARAAVVTFSATAYTNTTTTVTNDTLGTGQFNQSGSFVYAENSGGSALTFDGIAFSAASANIVYSNIAGTGFNTAYSNNTGGNALANNAVFTPGGAINTTNTYGVTLNNLNIGTAYRVQFLLIDSRTDANHGGGDRKAFFNSTLTTYAAGISGFDGGIFTNGTPSGTTTDYGTARLVTGLFIADAATQQIGINVQNISGTSNAGGQVNAVTLYAVPEPSTYGLLGAGALAGLAFVRRRRR